MKLTKIAAFAAALFAMGGAAFAAPVNSSYQASSAKSDALHGGSSDHAVWIPNIWGGSDFDFMPHGEIVFDAAGNAVLSGMITSQTKAGANFFVEFILSLRPGVGTSGPKKELKSSAYSNNGGPIDPSTWIYYDLVGGTITGKDSYDGVEFNVTERPAPGGKYPPQLGYGANNKNGHFGLSFWFNLSVSECDRGLLGDYCHKLAWKERKGKLYGDVNIDLKAVPLPAGFVLFGSGLLGLAFARRRKAA